MFIAQQLDLPAHPKGSYWGGIEEIQIFEDEAGGVPYDLTDATIELLVKTTKSQSATPVATWTTDDDSVLMISAVNGIFQVVGREIDLAAQRYHYAIKITPENDESFVIVYGRWPITELPA